MDFLSHYLSREHVETGIEAAQLFLACAAVVLAGYWLWARFEAKMGWERKTRDAKEPAILLAGAVRRQPAALALVDQGTADLVGSPMAHADRAQSLHRRALQQAESAEYLLLQLRKELDEALTRPREVPKSEIPAPRAIEPVPLAA